MQRSRKQATPPVVITDLAIIGSGPAGQAGAAAAREAGKSVVVIDERAMLGGGAIRTGTVPSKTLREAVVFLARFENGAAARSALNHEYIRSRVQAAALQTARATRAQLKRLGVTALEGRARFLGPHQLEVNTSNGAQVVEAQHVLIACGSRETIPDGVTLDHEQIIGVTDLPLLKTLPRQLIIVGAGVIGVEYASMFALLGAEVTLIDKNRAILEWVDRDLVRLLSNEMAEHGVVFRLGEKVAVVERRDARVVVRLAGDKTVRGDVVLYAVGRTGNADRLALEAAGLHCDGRGRLSVNERYRTTVRHIFAAGDVIGFPAFASTALAQGRVAVCHMFNRPTHLNRKAMPYGLHTVPEIALVGATEQELQQEGTLYRCGVARYEQTSKGTVLGDPVGFLKLLFDPESHRLLGVHVLGELATEMIHLGQFVLSSGGRIEYFRDSVFNYPTFSEAYRIAALNGLEASRRG